MRTLFNLEAQHQGLHEMAAEARRAYPENRDRGYLRKEALTGVTEGCWSLSEQLPGHVKLPALSVDTALKNAIICILGELTGKLRGCFTAAI